MLRFLKLDRLLSFIFKKEVELLQFRVSMLIIMLISLAVYTFGYAFLGLSQLIVMPGIELYVKLIHGVIAVAALLFFRSFKEYYQFVLYFVTGISLISFSFTLVLLPNDEFRAIWFFLLVIGAYIVGDIRLGLISSIGIIFIFIALSLFYDLGISHMAMLSISGSFILASLFLYAYTKRIDAYQDELIDKNSALERLATYDSLTQIMNRRLFLEMGEKYLSDVKRQGKSFFFLMIDIDHFKKINDTYGHHIGDETLRLFADIVNKSFRHSELFGRIGGEEFGAVILTDNEEAAYKSAVRLKDTIENSSFAIDNLLIKITVSIGLAKNHTNEELKSIMKRADDALYQAKNEGRNKIVMQSDL